MGRQLDQYMEGTWKEFVFKQITPDDHPKILEHLHKTFYKDELGCKLLEFGETEFKAFDAFVKKCLNQDDDISFYAEDKTTGKVAGVRITYKASKVDKKEDSTGLSEKMTKVLGFVNALKAKCNVFEKYEIDYFANFLIQSVDPEFRGQGLASEMYKRSLGLLKERGYPLCQSMFTSPYTRKAVANLGFEETGRMYFKDHVDEKGERVFPTATPEMVSVGMAKLL